MKTGTTEQLQFTQQTRIGKTIYAPGVYNSHNLDDVLPRKPEFTLHCNVINFAANDLEEVLYMWHEYICNHGNVKVISLTKLG